MPKLSDILYDADKAALASSQPRHITLQGGLAIVIDYSDPARRQVRLGRKWPTWPSSTELSTIRRYITIPPGADIERGQRGDWNVVIYSWRVPAPVCQ